MTEAVKAVDVLHPVVYRDCIEAVDSVVSKWEGDDEAAMSIYLSLKVVVKILEEELGINPVEVTVNE